MVKRFFSVVVKLLLSLLVIPLLAALFRAVQVSFSESAEYGFLGIIAYVAAWIFLWFIVLPVTALYALWIWFQWLVDEDWDI